MSYTDLRDFEPEYTYTSDEGLCVQVEKLGGGTVGRKYAGTWRYVVSNANGAVVARAQDYTLQFPHSHKWVARDIADYFVPEA